MKADGGIDHRHEVKFVTTAELAGHVDLWLKTSSFGFRSAYPDRIVNNLYFDTPDADALAEKLAGVSRRAKVRYRWYGSAHSIGIGRLEIKHRHNGVGWKDVYPIDAAPSDTRRAAWTRALRRAVPAAARVWLDDLAEPTLINRYRRVYLVSADGRVRATIDRDLQVFDQRIGTFPRLDLPAPLPRIVVLELKFARDQRARVSREVGELQFVASACSKYELGVRAIANL